jgi:hypothetical protein
MMKTKNDIKAWELKIVFEGNPQSVKDKFGSVGL